MSNINVAWKVKQKQQELAKNQLFLFCFSKNSGYKEFKTTNFERGSHKNFLREVLTIFRTSPFAYCQTCF